MSEVKLEKNVLEFIDECSKEVGKYKAEEFDQELYCACIKREMQSPIEQILYCALKSIQIFNYIEEWHGIKIEEKTYIEGLSICSQAKLGKYRCDFLIKYGSPVRPDGFQRMFKELIIECDSQQFHERTEKERRYEKARDRYLTMQEYKVFHYTGSEIVKRPLEIAGEILAYITDTDIKEMLLDSNIEN